MKYILTINRLFLNLSMKNFSVVLSFSVYVCKYIHSICVRVYIYVCVYIERHIHIFIFIATCDFGNNIF